jgi:hypothetical protein
VGILADADAKSLINRSYNTTKEEAAAVDRIVGSPLTLYTSHTDFARHALWELIKAYEEAGFPDDYLPDMTTHMAHGRQEAQRLRLRQEFQDILLIYETSLRDGMDDGDFDFILSTLDILEGYINRTPDEHWKRYIKRVILRSGVIKDAVHAFYEWAEDDDSSAGKVGSKGRHKYQVAAEKWSLWLEGLAE